MAANLCKNYNLILIFGKVLLFALGIITVAHMYLLIVLSLLMDCIIRGDKIGWKEAKS